MRRFGTALLAAVLGATVLATPAHAAATGTFTGVITGTDGQPVPYAEVTAKPEETFGGTLPYAYTGEDGRYTFTAPPGDYRIQVRQAALTQWAHQQLDEAGATVFPLAAGAEVTVDERLLPTGSVGGRLADAAGEPIAQAAVELVRDDIGVATTYSDYDGTYTFDAVLPGDDYQLSFVKDDGPKQWAYGKLSGRHATELTVTAGRRTTVDDAQLPVSAIGGRLTSPGGAGLADYQVSVQLDDEDNSAWYYATTDAQGDWSLPGGVLAGRYIVSFVNPEYDREQFAGGTGSKSDARRFTAAAGAPLTVDETWLPAATLRVAPVDSVTGAPVANFCAYLTAPRDGGGCTESAVLTAGNLSGGTFDLRLVPDRSGYYLAPAENLKVTLTAGQTTTITPRLVRGGKISVKVTDRATGRALRGACPSFAEPGTGGLSPRDIACTAADGTLTSRALPAGAHQVFVAAPGTFGHQWLGAEGGTGDQRKAARVTVTPGTVKAAPVARLDRGGSIRGTVTGADGNPVTAGDVAVTAWPYGTGPDENGLSVEIGDGGAYEVRKLGPYAWPLVITAQHQGRQWTGGTGQRFEADRIPVTAGAATTHDVTLEAGATLSGTAATASGEPARFYRLIAVNAVTGDEIGFFDGPEGGSGAYAIPLAGGQTVKLRYELSVAGGDRRGWVGGTDRASATAIAIPAADTATLNVTLS